MTLQMVILQQESKYFLYGIMFIFMIYVSLSVKQILCKRLGENRPDRLDLSFEQLRQYSDLEENGEKVLEIIGRLIYSPTYSLYRLDTFQRQYQLTMVRIQTEKIGEIRPSYSGLVPYKREVYYPPNTLPKDLIRLNSVTWVSGNVPSMTLSINGGQWLIVIGPIEYPHQKSIQKFERIITELNRGNGY